MLVMISMTLASPSFVLLTRGNCSGKQDQAHTEEVNFSDEDRETQPQVKHVPAKNLSSIMRTNSIHNFPRASKDARKVARMRSEEKITL